MLNLKGNLIKEKEKKLCLREITWKRNLENNPGVTNRIWMKIKRRICACGKTVFIGYSSIPAILSELLARQLAINHIYIFSP